MSSQTIAEPIVSRIAQAPFSLPLGNLCLTFGLSVLTLAIAGAAWGTIGYEMLIVAMGWPHILLGFLFYFGRVLHGEVRARSNFLLLALLTLALWTAHYTYTITGFIAIYFTYHVFRDEVFIYFQTRARHRLRTAVKVAGLIPFIFFMFLVTDPRPQYYRQDLRRVTLNASQLSDGGWTLIPFEPISYSKGKDFYFYLQTPSPGEIQSYRTLASIDNARAGEIRISNRTWPQASDLILEPFYSESPNASPERWATSDRAIRISLQGGYRVGQTFTAMNDNLAGIWLPTEQESASGQPGNYQFHLTADTSQPLPPLSPTLESVRLALLAVLLVFALWKMLPGLSRNRSFWIYFVFLAVSFALLQKVILAGGGRGYEFPIMFQLVVIFHYWSWYVFSFNKLRALSSGPGNAPTVKTISPASCYDRMIGLLRTRGRFVALVVTLNLISAAGVLWYSRFHGPAALRYVFDYSYFLYFLVFHVTFSFAPRQPQSKAKVRLPAISAAQAG